ncbi:MAG: FAD-dependent oxidoreductase [Ilumatobacteraceae bacterium]
MTTPRVLVVGGGIAGLAAALELLDAGGHSVEVWEADARWGGKISTSPFAGLDHVDEAADAFLTRVPHGVAFAERVGVDGAQLTSPTEARAAVWHGRLHDIPDGILLGVPAAILPFVTTGLLSLRGKLRAGLEPLVPRTDADDSLGRLIRARFGDEVHERLVDALVGSIYATDTDHASLASIPQLDALARSHRSLLLGGRALRRRASVPAGAGPIFATPHLGMGALIAAAVDAIGAAGGGLHLERRAGDIRSDGDAWRVDDERFDALVLASPARVTAPLVNGCLPDLAVGLASFEHADIVMVRLAVPGGEWPERLAGRSGYLVPKPDQRTVSAVSFGSQKWAHWRPDDGSQIVRISLGRDGLPTAHLGDDQLLERAITETGHHLDLDLHPTHMSVTRWTDAFPQYRPHHGDRVSALEGALPPTVALAGASYHGIGVPACIASGRRAARSIAAATGDRTGLLP